MKQGLKYLVPLLAIFVLLWGLESLPDLLLEAENLLRDYAQLDTNPASQARKQEIQYALQHLHEQLKAISSWQKRGL